MAEHATDGVQILSHLRHPSPMGVPQGVWRDVVEAGTFARATKAMHDPLNRFAIVGEHVRRGRPSPRIIKEPEEPRMNWDECAAFLGAHSIRRIVIDCAMLEVDLRKPSKSEDCLGARAAIDGQQNEEWQVQARPGVFARRPEQACGFVSGEPAVLAVLQGRDVNIRDCNQSTILFGPSEGRTQDAEFLGDGGEFHTLFETAIAVRFAGDRQNCNDIAITPPSCQALDCIIEALREANLRATILGKPIEDIDYCDLMGITRAGGNPRFSSSWSRSQRAKILSASPRSPVPVELFRRRSPSCQ